MLDVYKLLAGGGTHEQLLRNEVRSDTASAWAPPGTRRRQNVSSASACLTTTFVPSASGCAPSRVFNKRGRAEILYIKGILRNS